MRQATCSLNPTVDASCDFLFLLRFGFGQSVSAPCIFLGTKTFSQLIHLVHGYELFLVIVLAFRLSRGWIWCAQPSASCLQVSHGWRDLSKEMTNSPALFFPQLLVASIKPFLLWKNQMRRCISTMTLCIPCTTLITHATRRLETLSNLSSPRAWKELWFRRHLMLSLSTILGASAELANRQSCCLWGLTPPQSNSERLGSSHMLQVTRQ